MADSTFIHPSAVIDSRAKIGEGSKIWVNVQIRENAVVGKFCNVGKDVYIDRNVTIGSGCKIQNAVSIYDGVTIEEDVFVGPHACFTNDKLPRAFVADWKITRTLVKKGASIGANSTIVCGITIGEYAMIAAGSVVTHDVEPYTLVMGNPARAVSKINQRGERTENLG